MPARVDVISKSGDDDQVPVVITVNGRDVTEALREAMDPAQEADCCRARAETVEYRGGTDSAQIAQLRQAVSLYSMSLRQIRRVIVEAAKEESGLTKRTGPVQ